MTSRRAPVRVGLWGIGEHARRNLLPAFEKADGVHVSAVHTRREEVRAAAVAQLGAVDCRTPESLLDTDVEAVYLAVPPGLHAEFGLRVLESGKHLWCEKPLACELAQAEALIAYGERAGLAVFEAFMFQFHPQFVRVKELARQGRLGDIVEVAARFGFPHRDSSDFRYDPALGGGAFLDAGSYPICAARLLLADPVCIGGSIEREAGFAVDTGGAALLRNGAGATAALSWGFGRAYRNELEVWGREGVAFVPRAFSKPADLATTIVIRRSDGMSEEVIVPGADHFALMLEAFAGAVRNDSLDTLRTAAREQGTLMDAVRGVALGR